jgi:hypothetical protein
MALPLRPSRSDGLAAGDGEAHRHLEQFMFESPSTPAGHGSAIFRCAQLAG